ncbi:sugar phosphate isomerase/epimerase family protein [Pseudofrankia saprophytica]|nr:sugar phosphate isomerase/epimerase family protein [Pseudofrankia saprophytica]OHV39306.1 hypothetical protein BCD49_11445 [Pseudofrankia sp. EUN1h]
MVNLAGEAGFTAVEVPLRDAYRDGAPRTRDLLAEAGMAAGGARFPVEFRADDRTFAEDLAALPALAGFAARIGVRVMCRSVPPSSDLPMHLALPIIRGRLVLCARVLEEAGIRLALEFHSPLHLRRARPHEFLWRMEDTLSFARSCGENVGLLLDSWHWYHAGAGTAEILAAGGDILCVEVADAASLRPADVRDDQRLLPGRGVIDFQAFFGALRSVGYDGPLTPEVIGYRHPGPPVDAARAALDATLSALDRHPSSPVAS